MNSHSLISPSSADKWVHCTGYPLMALQHPRESGSAATEGERAHYVAAETIRRAAIAQLTPLEGDPCDDVRVYTDDVIRVMRDWKIFGGPHWNIEKRINCPEIHPECWGTPDAWIYNDREKHLIIWDLKYGYLPVDVFENQQLIAYASGVLTLLDMPSSATIELRVCQPRAPHRQGPLRTWRTSHGELLPYIERLSKSAHCVHSSPATVPGVHCRYCEGRHACLAAQEIAFDAHQYAHDPVGVNLSNEQAARELTLLRHAATAIENRLTGLEADVTARIKRGDRVPGYSMEPTRGNLQWCVDRHTVVTTGKAYGLDLEKKSLITPTQAKKLGIDTETVDMLSERVKTGVKLVESDAKTARRIFK